MKKINGMASTTIKMLLRQIAKDKNVIVMDFNDERQFLGVPGGGMSAYSKTEIY